MPNQRSILSFFGSSSSTELPKPSSQQLPQLQPKPAFGQQPTSQQRSHPPPPPPPPPSSARFVPPPSARNGIPNGTANNNGSTSHPGMTVAASAMRWGGTTEPNVNLAPITPAYGRSILQAAGATEDAEGNIVFSPSSPSSSNKNKIVFPRDIHMPDLVSINGILLPVRYSDSFYKHVTNTTRIASLFNRVILGDVGEVVGGIVCRLEPSPFTSDSSGSSSATSTPTPSLAVYVQSLALLSPYRGRGLMAAAFESIVATVQALNVAAATPTGPLAATGPVTALFAHVWTEHDDAMAWYIARKFVRQGDAPIEDYYFALRPATAWVVRRDVPAGVPASVSQRVLEATKKTKESTVAAPPPPPPLSSSSHSSQNSQKLLPPPNVRSQSYQNSRPETEWNDLPADMMAATSASASLASSRNPSRKVSQANLTGDATAAVATGTENGNGDSPPSLLAPPTANGSQASSRSSSSTGKKKRERAYPAAMFQ